MNWNRVWVLMPMLALTMVLAACSTPKPTVVTQIETKVVQISPELLRDCEISTPPLPADYMAASVAERIQLLEQYSYRLLGDLNKCNLDKADARRQQSEFLRIYGDKSQ